jgi:hypothetical protein
VVGGALCNFCRTPHRSLRLSGGARAAGGSHCIKRTLAQAAALTDRHWSVHELPTFSVPPSLLRGAGDGEMTRRGYPSRLTTRIHG